MAGNGELAAEILAAAGCAAAFCGDTEIWPQFEEWLRANARLGPKVRLSRQMMDAASIILLHAYRAAEIVALEQMLDE